MLQRQRTERRLRSIKAVLFDLDGTLLQVSMGEYIPQYIEGIGRHLQDLVEPRQFARTARHAVQRLFSSPDGKRTNEQHYLASIEEGTGISPSIYQQRLQDYFSNGMHELAPIVESIPQGRSLVENCASQGLKVALATNPVFPRTLVQARLDDAGLQGLSFDLLTSYENSYFCKPDARYYHAIAEKLGLSPEQCLMVGNDTDYDLGAADAGMMTYLVDTYLEDRLDGRWRADFQGDHQQLALFVQQLSAMREN